MENSLCKKKSIRFFMRVFDFFLVITFIFIVYFKITIFTDKAKSKLKHLVHTPLTLYYCYHYFFITDFEAFTIHRLKPCDSKRFT